MAAQRTARAAWAGPTRIDTPGDVERVLAAVNTAGLGHGNTAAMPTPAQTGSDVELSEPDASRIQPVIAEFRDLMPWPGGIRKGATLAAVGSTSILLALLAGAMTSGAWAAAAGIPE